MEKEVHSSQLSPGLRGTSDLSPAKPRRKQAAERQISSLRETIWIPPLPTSNSYIRKNSKFLTVAYKALPVPSWPHFLTLPWPTLSSSLLLQLTNLVPASGPLHSLFCLECFSYRSSTKITPSEGTSLTSQFKVSPFCHSVIMCCFLCNTSHYLKLFAYLSIVSLPTEEYKALGRQGLSCSS